MGDRIKFTAPRKRAESREWELGTIQGIADDRRMGFKIHSGARGQIKGTHTK